MNNHNFVNYKIATGQIGNSKSIKNSQTSNPVTQTITKSETQVPNVIHQDPRFIKESQHSVISIPGENGIIHKGVVVGGRALGPGAENTHFFDGMLVNNSFMSLIEEEVAKDIKENIDRAGNVDYNVKKKAFEKLYQTINTQKDFIVTPNASRCLGTIINIHDSYGRTSVAGNQNYSPSDKLHACDLLYLLYEKIVEQDNKEYLNLLLSQLDEMATGMCQQGRCNRLFQTYVMLRDDLSPTSKPRE